LQYEVINWTRRTGSKVRTLSAPVCALHVRTVRHKTCTKFGTIIRRPWGGRDICGEEGRLPPPTPRVGLRGRRVTQCRGSTRGIP